ncbi:hypothetical protein ERO13_A02G060400v2 [Gossypium hirsutum]|uniref:Uncharacterized protein isoform X2 n=4 Tax=Gossypium TaxID=3633 RepID=A0A1U8NT45_GOSHI|nr:uncharacterized protein LOC107951569 isoform X2 [Gossypium hirsutum]KAB2092970.1 hypothetical protein ES319_A02G065600v1 [Gossypium barbadense]KAG4210656.1 hypothetical protein ERO13_A02G060400v2 [Gossypium hirsutum]TYH27494.1 hypothetical protein ES288_A02G073600v1 [Gossypium darwinii]TYJ45628.1 hypothetical protein E1A91_A02G069700v1 [Gossypium mustelinum]
MDLWFSCLGWGLPLPFLSDLTKPHFFSIQHLQHSLLQVINPPRANLFVCKEVYIRVHVGAPKYWIYMLSSCNFQNNGEKFAGMLGKSLASSLMTLDSATSCFCVPDVATSAANIVPFSVTLSSRLPQTVIGRVGSSHFSPHKWAINVNTEGKTWEACRQALSAFGFTDEEEDKILGKAFGHVHSPYWGEERKKEEPRFEIVNEILEYLRSLGLSDDDLRKLLKKFPEVLGCDIEHELRTNVQILEKDWGIKGKSLKNLLLRNPKVLGYNVDCKGDCIAQCTRCWVRF